MAIRRKSALEIAAQTGNGAALGEYMSKQSAGAVPQTAGTTTPPTAGETRTPPLPTAGATTPPPAGATTDGTGTAYQKYLEMEARKERDRIMTSGDTRAINRYLQQENMQRTADRLADSGNTQAAEQMRRSLEAQARAKAALSGNQQQNNTYYQAQTPYQAAIAQAKPVTMNDYTWWNWMGENKLTNMSEADKAKWNRAVAGWKNGDYRAFNDDFETVGNWSSYVDDNGNVNGMLRYVGDGVGGYIPVSEGMLLQREGFGNDPNTYAFYGPNGEVYTADANGRLTRTGNWTKQVLTRPYNDAGLHGTFKSSNGQTYDYDTAPDDVLASHGFYRGDDGLVRIMSPQDAIGYGVKSGAISLEQGAFANDVLLNGGKVPGGNTPRGYTPRDPGDYVTNYAGEYANRTPTPSPNPTPATTNNQPVQNTQPSQPTVTPGGYQPTPSDTVNIRGGDQNDQNIYQRYLDQWDYPDAPEWNGTEYERQRDAALEAAQNMRWDGSEYQTERDRLLEEAMRPYEGSPYDKQRDDALAQYGETWQGSEYQKERDAALKRAQEMQWDYNPETDPVWQAYQKQYRREGQRATQDTLGQLATMTGGMPSSYAVTAASQAGDYYAAQLSDRLPQLYQDAYQRYLQEFQRQLGISDQYQGFDDREYSRWADQQGKNLDLADRYNQYGQQDYDQYRDRVSQQLSGADRYNGYDQTEYQRYLDQYGQQLDAADRYNNYGATEYDRYRDQLGQHNTDRNFSYGRYRDAVGDYRYDDETQYNRAWNEEVRDYNRAYQAQRDAILDNRADREWAQELRAYADAQNWKATEWEQYLREYGDQLSEKQRQWAYQMQRDAISDERWERQYADQRSDTMYNRALQEDQTAYQRALQADALAYDRQQDALDREYKQNAFQASLDQWQAEYDADQNNTEYNRAMNRWKLYGTVQPGDEAILGAPAGTAYPTSGGSTGGYSGGGSGGGGKTTGGDDLGPGQYKQGGIVYRSDKTHPQGQPMSAMYEQAYNDAWDKWQRGMDYALLIAEVTNLKLNKSITDYEGQMILNELRKWKEQGRMIDASKGGGMGSPRTQMTK